jgi:hypothetical protein
MTPELRRSGCSISWSERDSSRGRLERRVNVVVPLPRSWPTLCASISTLTRVCPSTSRSRTRKRPITITGSPRPTLATTCPASDRRAITVTKEGSHSTVCPNVASKRRGRQTIRKLANSCDSSCLEKTSETTTPTNDTLMCCISPPSAPVASKLMTESLTREPGLALLP